MNDAKKPTEPKQIPAADPSLGEETVVGDRQSTEVSFDELLKQAVREPQDAYESEPACQKLIEELKDLNNVRQLAREKDVAPPFPTQLGQFELLECLGQGGMGQVFKARHAQLGKIQVVKVLHEFRLSDPQVKARFRQEMRAIGALSHPNIVAAHHADEVDGIPYLVMDYVEGQSLAELVAKHRTVDAQLPIAAACELVRQAAIGLQYAHDQGIVHRDIKPGNMMLDAFGNVRILDLGLARITSQENEATEELTSDYQILGTPDYMAPEQLRSSKDVDARADVYALAATLYCLLTGRPPYAGEEQSGNILDKAMQVMNSPVPDIRRQRDDIPEELATLIAHSLQKSPDDRISTSQELAEELAQWASIESVQQLADPKVDNVETESSVDASAPTRKYENTSESRDRGRFPWRWSVVGVIFAAFLTGVIYQLSLPNDGKLVIECDDPNAKIAIHAVQGRKLETLNFSQQGEKSFVLDVGNWSVSITGLEADRFELDQKSVKISKNSEARLSIVRIAPENQESTRPDNSENLLADSKAEHRPSPNRSSAGQPGDEQLLNRLSNFDWQAGESAKLAGYASFPSSFKKMPFDWQILPKFAHHRYGYEISPKGTYVVSYHESAYDPYIRILERKTGRLVGMFYHQNRYDRHVSWSPDESKFIVSWYNWRQHIQTVCKLDGTVLFEWSKDQVDGGERSTPVWSPDGSRILFVTRNSIEQRTPDGTHVESFVPPGHGGRVESHIRNSLWSPDGSRFAIATGGEIRVYSRDGGQPLAILKGEEGVKLDYCVWHPGGEKILTNGPTPYSARLWRLSGDFIQFGVTKPWKTFETFREFSPDGRLFITSTGHIHDLTDEYVAAIDTSMLGDFDVTLGRIQARWVEQDRIIVTTADQCPGLTIDCSPSGKLLSVYDHPIPIPQQSLSWMHNEDRFQSVGGSVSETWNFQWGTDPQQDKSTKFGEFIGNRVAFSPAKQAYAGSVGNGLIGVFDDKGHQQHRVNTNGSDRLCAWSPDGELLAAAGNTPGNIDGGPILIWHGSELVTEFEGHEHEILGLSWSPSGEFIATWDSSLKVSIWDPKTPAEPVTTRTGFGFQLGRSSNWWSFNVSCPRWSPDGDLLAIPSEDGVLLVSPAGGPDVKVPIQKERLGVIWWTPDGESLIVGKTIYDLKGKKIRTLGDDNYSIPFLNWLSNDEIVMAWHRGVAIYDNIDDKPTVLSLPGFEHSYSPSVTLLSRGMNAQRVSSDERYFIHQTGVQLTNPNSYGGGDIYLIDLRKKQHLWTGLAFNDGTPVRIEPTGRVRSLPGEFDKYLTYVIHYSTGRILPQTQMQFASRMELSPAQQVVQRTLDFGGTVTLNDQKAPLLARDINDSRELPEIEQITGVDLSKNRYLDDAGLAHIEKMMSLTELNVQGTAVTNKGLSKLSALTSLRQLNISGLKINDSLIVLLPTTLEDLDLSHTDIGDFSMFDLKHFKSLKRVNVVDTKVTQDGIAALKQALPDCEIAFEE